MDSRCRELPARHTVRCRAQLPSPRAPPTRCRDRLAPSPRSSPAAHRGPPARREEAAWSSVEEILILISVNYVTSFEVQNGRPLWLYVIRGMYRGTSPVPFQHG